MPEDERSRSQVDGPKTVDPSPIDPDLAGPNAGPSKPAAVGIEEDAGDGRQAITPHISKVLASKGNHPPLIIGKVSAKNADLVRHQTAIDIAGHMRHFGSSDIRHVMRSHGNAAREAARGQIAIKKGDFEHIPTIVENAHTVTAEGSRASRKGLRLNYVAQLGAHQYEYVEMVRSGKVVALKSMRKK